MTAKLRALTESDSWHFHNNDSPKCPHCGTEYDIDRHEAWHLYDTDEGDHKIGCDNCDMEFTVSVQVSFGFSTDEQPDEDEA